MHLIGVRIIDTEKKYFTCKRVIYYGITDEGIFFAWLKRIKCIESFEGARDELYLDLKNEELSENDLLEILGLFKRYNIDMKQVRSFLTDKNSSSLRENKKAFWYKPLFAAEAKRK